MSPVELASTIATTLVSVSGGLYAAYRRIKRILTKWVKGIVKSDVAPVLAQINRIEQKQIESSNQMTKVLESVEALRKDVVSSVKAHDAMVETVIKVVESNTRVTDSALQEYSKSRVQWLKNNLALVKEIKSKEGK